MWRPLEFMSNPIIEGVKVTPLRQIPDERGKIMHMLRSDASHFVGFGEIYFSCVYPSAIKAWHIHSDMTLNYSVPIGHIKFVLYDDRPESPSRGKLMELFPGESNYVLITVPPRVWNGFKGIGDKMAMVANCASIPHRPDEISRKDPFTKEIPYDWAIRHG